MNFIPAQNKLEAVARISQLTGSGAETLGPGSKERKSVVLNLAIGLGISIDASATKHEIARTIASDLGVRWSSECESRGQTLTLRGLNLLLEAATSVVDENTNQSKDSESDDELGAVSQVAIDNTPHQMDGRSCVLEMKQAEFRPWRQTEWQGFYFEFKVCPALINQLGGGPKKVVNTTFDYSRTKIWDLKVHSASHAGKNNPSIQLNDKRAIQEAVRSNGFGLIVLSGIPHFDYDFTVWHKKLRGHSDLSFGRTLKSKFESKRLDFFFFDNLDVLEVAIDAKVLSDFNQGRQPSGHVRRPKYSLNLKRAIDSPFHYREFVL